MTQGEIVVTVVKTRGSTPREIGARLHVRSDSFDGTIGGGALEWEAMRIARQMLADGTTDLTRTFPLGPDLGQCCGGVVTLSFATGAQAIEPLGPPVYIWGAGHVGRALARTIAPFERMQVTLIDTSADRLPDPLPLRVTPLVAADMPRAVPHTDPNGIHYIVTYSHDIDLALCDALLRHGFDTCGLIGSATKWARFRKRLGQMGHTDAQISRILCPIGDPSLGKHPQAIAIGVTARLLGRQMPQESAIAQTSGGT
ncbi:xanthine dehydrogenase accessory protein XdhC [Hasllibacter sp. MH4015]|uniref:xanthine dehydrogenase accessory protein XdhC n=1 Tax=Hasllibacter sp. MH4015 TaxID=2854029 RepID=UPI001CD4EAA2|nr:xanthine dehydrogenase accessory protein XdhC [Hasllibacter sp. MH4015]